MLSLLDSLLGAISFFDLITPITAHLQNLVRGPTYTFHIPHRAGWGIYSVERLLKEAGCEPVWGKRISMNTMKLSVRKEDAQRGYWALHNAGVPVENGVPKGVSPPARSKATTSLADDLANFLDW
jgi:hypothetical protein